jgi:hypothetical protein
MPSLRDTQRAFLSALRTGDASGVRGLVMEDGLPVEQRVQIYRNNWQLGLLAALQATFPVVVRLGGTDWFEQSARSYQQQFPSRRGDLQFVGEHYADFLQLEFAGTPYEYFADVARLEWAYQETLIAGECVPFDAASLAAVRPEDYGRLMFQPRKALRLVQSPFPILAIWNSNTHDTVAGASVVRLDAGPSRVLVIRRSDHVELRELAPDTFRLLELLSCSSTLSDATDAIAASSTDFDLAASLRQLVVLEAFHSWQLRPVEQAANSSINHWSLA